MQDRIFRALLRLLPEEFRAAYARDMESTFRAERRSVGGPGQIIRLWISTILDILGRAPAEHVDILRRDLRFALRSMRARPMATATALLTLAVGIGANVAIYAVVQTVLLNPLPYDAPSKLVSIRQTESGEDGSNLGYLTFVDLQTRSHSFETMAAVGGSTATLTGGGADAERVNAMRVSHTYFDMLGVTPALGRTFLESEDRPGAARRVVILSHALWQRRFSSDPSVIDRTIIISDTPYRVVGVLPAGLQDMVAQRMYQGAELWYPLGYDPAASFACRTCQHLSVFGRLMPDATPASASRELGSLFASLEQEHPTEYHEAGAEVLSLDDVFLGPVRPVLLVLWAGVGVLLLVAFGNVTNLLLLQASERLREVSVRTALGITRRRLARQLITESLLLAGLGGAAGVGLAWIAVSVVATQGPRQIPRLSEVVLSEQAVAGAIALALASGLAFGLISLRQLRSGVGQGLPAGPTRGTDNVSTWQTRSVLVSVNVAMALLLLVGSGLLVRSMTGLLSVSPGFNPSGVLTMQVWASGERFRQGDNADQIATAVQFYEQVLSQARALPGVTAASAVTTLPLGGGVDGYGFHVQGRPSDNPEAAPSADRFVVAPDFLATMQLAVRQGRFLNDRDTQSSEPVAVINETAAATLFAGEDPLGHRVSLGPPTAQPRTIVGVVADVRHHGLDVPVGFQVYLPQSQWAWAETYLTLLVRTDGDPLSLAGPMREVVRRVDPAQPVTDIRPYTTVVDASTGARRFAASLLTTFALTALAMAIVGLYGTVGVMVAQRRREIGIRMALGAHADAIRRLVLSRGLRPVAIGLVAGLGLAWVSVGALRAMLFGVGATDPTTFAAAVGTLAVSALVACGIPAWRAARIEPALVVRE